MKLFLSYLRLIRPFNLVMIVFTLYMVRLFFLLSASNQTNPELHVGQFTFALFALSFVLIAAAGYVINDYYDVEIDKINKPQRIVIGNILSARSALVSYWILNILGIITGFISCFWAGVPLLGTLFLFYLAGLWFYSNKLKSTFLSGNILIGIFLALVPLGGAAIELYAKTSSLLPEYDEGAISFIWKLMGGIAIFAFLSTIIREIVKDAEDVDGDSLAGCHTMSVVIGVKKTKWVVFSLLIILNSILGYLEYQCISLGTYLLLYYIICIQVPLLFIYRLLLKASSTKYFHKISTWIKVLMLTGIIYVFTIAFEAYSVYLFFNSLFK